MKKILQCKTTRAAVILPFVGWFIQWYNGGMLPMFVQTWGPMLVAVGVILFRRVTSEACRICGK